MKKNFSLVIILITLIAVFGTAAAAPAIPVTGTPSNGVQASTSSVVSSVSVTNVFKYDIVQQPKNNPAYVSTKDGVLTQFDMASQYGSLGLLAHNYLAGAPFSKVKANDLIYVNYTDGSTKIFKVTEIRTYQALSPKSPYSKFIDLSNNKTLTSNDLFFATYGIKDNLVLQTCIAKGNEDSWGRLFIIATPYVPTNTGV